MLDKNHYNLVIVADPVGTRRRDLARIWRDLRWRSTAVNRVLCRNIADYVKKSLLFKRRDFWFGFEDHVDVISI